MTKPIPYSEHGNYSCVSRSKAVLITGIPSFCPHVIHSRQYSTTLFPQVGHRRLLGYRSTYPSEALKPFLCNGQVDDNRIYTIFSFRSWRLMHFAVLQHPPSTFRFSPAPMLPPMLNGGSEDRLYGDDVTAYRETFIDTFVAGKIRFETDSRHLTHKEHLQLGDLSPRS